MVIFPRFITCFFVFGHRLSTIKDYIKDDVTLLVYQTIYKYESNAALSKDNNLLPPGQEGLSLIRVRDNFYNLQVYMITIFMMAAGPHPSNKISPSNQCVICLSDWAVSPRGVVLFILDAYIAVNPGV